MCKFSGKLIAWFDHELPANEAADVERHVQTCTECRNRIAAYQQVSVAFDSYCEAAMASKVPHRVPLWAPVLSAAAAVAAVALLMTFPRVHVRPLPPRPSAETAPPEIVLRAAAAPVKKVHRRHAVAPVQSHTAERPLAEPAVQIAIPAEAMFPPGALPEGVNFIADVSIAADGSAQRLRLWP